MAWRSCPVTCCMQTSGRSASPIPSNAGRNHSHAIGRAVSWSYSVAGTSCGWYIIQSFRPRIRAIQLLAQLPVRHLDLTCLTMSCHQQSGRSRTSQVGIRTSSVRCGSGIDSIDATAGLRRYRPWECSGKPARDGAMLTITSESEPNFPTSRKTGGFAASASIAVATSCAGASAESGRRAAVAQPLHSRCMTVAWL